MSKVIQDNVAHFDFSLAFQNGKHKSIVRTLPCHVGRGDQNQIRIRHWKVSKSHARFFQLAEGIYVEDFGSISGTYLNQIRISRAGPLRSGDQIVIGPCKLSVSPVNAAIQHPLHMVSPLPETVPYPDEQNLDKDTHEIQNTKQTSVRQAISVQAIQAFYLQSSSSTHSVVDTHQNIFDSLRQSLFHDLDIRKQDITGMSGKDLRQFANLLLEDIIARDFNQADDHLMRQLKSAVLDEAFGFGLIEPLLSDPDVSEIMINQYDKVFVERHGSMQPHPLRFSSESALRTVIDRMLQSAGKRIDESAPMSDARLKCGSRVNAVIPPISFHGACLTLRKFPESRISLDLMVERQSMSYDVCEFLKKSVKNKKSLLISGGTGTGKTTLLNALIAFIPKSERLVTIEDAPELSLCNSVNHVSLETRAKNIEGQGEVTIRELVKNALRMRPDRIIIGECRGAEALDMLSAMNTGHEGSMTTLHANSPRDAISRLETLVLMAQHGLPVAAIREQIASAIDLIVQIKRHETGNRIISSVMAITGIESGVLQLENIFEFDGSARSGHDLKHH